MFQAERIVKSKGPEAGQDLVCAKSIMEVNLTETEMWKQGIVIRN